MRTRSRRLESLLCAGMLLLPLALGCNESSTRPARTIALTQELRFAPSGFEGTFTASAALRVNWTFRLERILPPGDDRDPVYKQTIDAQEFLFIRWDGTANSGFGEFAPGDSLIATVHYVQLGAEDAERARLAFRL